ncbi:hypothetical protein BPNPMPFG_008019 (plasmid) [Mesorhizobium sp. AR07]|uniref:hypothetical protein n=1 Tax=Mesorhizobium sp. AR07 TaxID=2865838 RepID=UPI00215F638B|nr:hypothetical protein [Mesorhizobium sp. AR07]UVK48359.1 hypothetical protein BPNPMPFG_008019 [Mesorhizobium sp. AR07]
MAERTISKNIDVQPTLEIRPGYKFNIWSIRTLDIVFPGAYLIVNRARRPDWFESFPQVWANLT